MADGFGKERAGLVVAVLAELDPAESDLGPADLARDGSVVALLAPLRQAQNPGFCEQIARVAG
jgi:hypothetical protein